MPRWARAARIFDAFAVHHFSWSRVFLPIFPYFSFQIHLSPTFDNTKNLCLAVDNIINDSMHSSEIEEENVVWQAQTAPICFVVFQFRCFSGRWIFARKTIQIVLTNTLHTTVVPYLLVEKIHLLFIVFPNPNQGDTHHPRTDTNTGLSRRKKLSFQQQRNYVGFNMHIKYQFYSTVDPIPRLYPE